MKTNLDLINKPTPPMSKIRHNEIESESELSLLKKFFSNDFDYFLIVFSVILTILFFVLIVQLFFLHH